MPVDGQCLDGLPRLCWWGKLGPVGALRILTDSSRQKNCAKKGFAFVNGNDVFNNGLKECGCSTSWESRTNSDPWCRKSFVQGGFVIWNVPRTRGFGMLWNKKKKLFFCVVALYFAEFLSFSYLTLSWVGKLKLPFSLSKILQEGFFFNLHFPSSYISTLL